MFKNYFKIIYRNVRRNKIYSFINVVGLALGIACCLLILMYVWDELSFDRHFLKDEQIYRLVADQSTSVGTRQLAVAPTAWGPALKAEYPDIKNMVRIWPYAQIAFYNEIPFKVVNLRVDSTFFEVFGLRLMQGDPKTVLDDPWKIILSKQTAKSMFGEENPLGKFIEIDTEINKLQVSGIMEDVPPNSHFRADVVTLFTPWMREEILPYWTSLREIHTYIELPEKAAARDLEQKLPAFLLRHLPKEDAAQFSPLLQPLTDIHLRSDRDAEILPGGDIRYVYLFSSVALFILLIACFNFMNLVTAKSAERAKEVGMRKTLGAQRWQLIGQFLGEAILLSIIALFLALIIVDLGLPTFNTISGKNLVLKAIFTNKLAVAGLLLGTIFIGMLAGSYPAFFLSAYKPVDVLRGGFETVSGGEVFRKSLVVFQFTIAIVLITSTVVVYQQLRYLQDERLGFDKEHIVILPIQHRNMKFNQNLFKNEVLQYSSVLKVAATSDMPGDSIGLRKYRLESVSGTFHAACIDADHDFAETLSLKLVAGRWFSKEMATDSSAFVMNEAAVRMFGMASPEYILGRRLQRLKFDPDSSSMIHLQGPVIGIVRDFHYASLHENVKPLIFNVPKRKWHSNWFAIKISSEHVGSTLDLLEKKWKAYTSTYPYSYSFLDEKLDALYRSEQRLGKIFSAFAGLTILIACLGLFGLASFTAERRIKEIGVRKALGASVSQIVVLLSKDVLTLVVLAMTIAVPIAYYGMREWLQNFSYRINIGAETFVLSGLLTIVIASVTISYRSIKAALINPADALRYE